MPPSTLHLPMFLLAFFSAVIDSVTSFAWSEFVLGWIVRSVAVCAFKGFWCERGCGISFKFVVLFESFDRSFYLDGCWLCEIARFRFRPKSFRRHSQGRKKSLEFYFWLLSSIFYLLFFCCTLSCAPKYPPSSNVSFDILFHSNKLDGIVCMV